MDGRFEKNRRPIRGRDVEMQPGMSVRAVVKEKPVQTNLRRGETCYEKGKQRESFSLSCQGGVLHQVLDGPLDGEVVAASSRWLKRKRRLKWSYVD